MNWFSLLLLVISFSLATSSEMNSSFLNKNILKRVLDSNHNISVSDQSGYWRDTLSQDKAILNQIILLISPILCIWYLLKITMDSKNSLGMGRGDSTQRQKLCILVNSILSYFQEIYFLILVDPNFPTSLLFVSEPIANPSSQLFGLLNSFSNEEKGILQVALNYCSSFGVNFVATLVLLKFSFSFWFLKKNIFIIFLCTLLLQNFGFVQLAFSLISSRDLDGNSSIIRQFFAWFIFVLLTVIIPSMIIQFFAKKQIKNEEAQARIQLVFFGAGEEIIKQSNIHSTWWYAYIHHFAKFIILCASLYAKKDNFFLNGIIASYFTFLQFFNSKVEIGFLKNWQSKIILAKPGICLASFLASKLFFSTNSKLINNGGKWILFTFNLAYLTILVIITINETCKKLKAFTFLEDKGRLELESFGNQKNYVSLEISQNNGNGNEDDEDEFGAYQTDDINPNQGQYRNADKQNSEDSEPEPEDDETIAKEELRGLCDEEDD